MRPETPDIRSCKGCGYNLWNISSQRCPECGREFDPFDPSTFVVSQPRSLDGDWCMWGSVAALVAGMGLPLISSPFDRTWPVVGLVLGVLIAAVVLWNAIPGVLGRIDNVSHRRAMHAGCFLALLVLIGDSFLLVDAATR
jgi:hypothetical protein